MTEWLVRLRRGPSSAVYRIDSAEEPSIRLHCAEHCGTFVLVDVQQNLRIVIDSYRTSIFVCACVCVRAYI